MPRADTRSVIQRFSSSSQKRLFMRFTSKRRLVWRFEWLTFEPTSGFLPVTWQTRDMARLLDLRLFEFDVLADDRVVLLQHELVGGTLAVLGRRVEEARVRRRDEADELAT